MNTVESFYNNAKEFCAYIIETEISMHSIDHLIELLMSLYIAALNLPDMEPETVKQSDGDFLPLVEVRIEEGLRSWYWEIFDPFEDEEPVCGSFVDDLSDIIRDIQEGIKEYEAGRIGNAVFEWQFGLDYHWGHHAVDLIRALHCLRIK